MSGLWERWSSSEQRFISDTDITMVRVNHIPAQFTVKCPNGQQRVQGPYLLQDERANGMPLWRQKGGHFWIYAMTNGAWGFGTAKEWVANFDAAVGTVCCNTRHNGMLPHRMLGHWLGWNGEEWLEDPEITLIEGWERPEDLPASLRLTSPNGEQVRRALTYCR